ncbi:MAG: DNA mismatch repair protein MutT [Bacteroidetes bacterium]|nr:MAG: DNA mismatch repair protein MutT [Bacteroidota bacterium]
MNLDTAGLIVVRNRKLLLAFSRNKQAFYLPGGKISDGETAKEGLIREVMEELSVNIDAKDLVYYTHIEAQAFGEANGIIMQQECFMYELKEEPNPNSEIGEIKYFDLETYLQEQFRVPGVVMVLEKLKEDNLVD